MTKDELIKENNDLKKQVERLRKKNLEANCAYATIQNELEALKVWKNKIITNGDAIYEIIGKERGESLVEDVRSAFSGLERTNDLFHGATATLAKVYCILTGYHEACIRWDSVIEAAEKAVQQINHMTQRVNIVEKERSEWRQTEKTLKENLTYWTRLAKDAEDKYLKEIENANKMLRTKDSEISELQKTIDNCRDHYAEMSNKCIAKEWEVREKELSSNLKKAREQEQEIDLLLKTRNHGEVISKIKQLLECEVFVRNHTDKSVEVQNRENTLREIANVCHITTWTFWEDLPYQVRDMLTSRDSEIKVLKERNFDLEATLETNTILFHQEQQKVLDHDKKIKELTGILAELEYMAPAGNGKWNELPGRFGSLIRYKDQLISDCQSEDQSLRGSMREKLNKLQEMLGTVGWNAIPSRVEELVRKVSSLEKQIDEAQSDNLQHFWTVKEIADAVEYPEGSLYKDLPKFIKGINSNSCFYNEMKKLTNQTDPAIIIDQCRSWRDARDEYRRTLMDITNVLNTDCDYADLPRTLHYTLNSLQNDLNRARSNSDASFVQELFEIKRLHGSYDNNKQLLKAFVETAIPYQSYVAEMQRKDKENIELKNRISGQADSIIHKAEGMKKITRGMEGDLHF